MLKKFSKRLLATLSLVILAAGLAYWSLRDNFHVVIPGTIYRSAQLSKPELLQTIHDYKLRTILNLRGNNPKQTWYQQEMAVINNVHIQHFNIALNSTKLPSHAQLVRLVDILQTAPKPLLLHCEGGADRAGLASVITVLLADKSVHAAQQQLSWQYFVLKSNSVGKQLLPMYQQWLQQHNDSTSSKQRFLAWLKTYKG